MNPTRNNLRYKTGALFAFSFLTASSYVFMRAIAVSIFLARLGPDGLPLAFFASATVVIFVSGLTNIAVRKLPTNRAAAGTWVLMGLLTILLGYILGPLHHSLLALCALYVFVEVRGSLNTIYVVSISSDVFVGQKSKRPYAIVASGAPIAGILVGFILGAEASIVMLWPAFILTAVVDGITAINAALIPSSRGVENVDLFTEKGVSSSADNESSESESNGDQLRYRRLLVALVSVKIMVLTLVGYQWKVSIGGYYGINEAQMLSYFAIFYAVSDTLIVLLQWLVVGKLMDRLGIGVGLIGLPLAVGLVGVVALFVNTPLALMIVFTFGKGLNVLRRAIHDPSLTVAFTGLDSDIRPESIVFIKGMAKPFSEAIAASVLLAIGGVILEYWITWIWLLATIPWFFFAVKVSRMYRKLRKEPAVIDESIFVE